jgi:CubicO group peptidase (beta-lactamase class C family)
MFRFFPLIFLAILVPSCDKESDRLPCDLENSTPVFQTPPELGDGWKVSGFAEARMSSKPVQDMLDEIESWGDHHIEAVLIVKDNRLVFEKYYPGNDFNWNDISVPGPWVDFGPTTRHFLASESKSVTSLLFGIAMDKGLITDINDRIESYYASAYPNVFQGQKREVTIRQLLTMSSGYSWDEWSSYPNDRDNLFRSPDPIGLLLNLPMQYAPGTTFHYNSGGTNILGDLIHRTSGINLRDFARQNLFAKLGITNWDWKSIRGEDIFASGGLFMTPRDFAKIGQLCLNGGQWNGKQIVSEDWIKESMRSSIIPTEFGLGNGYGYQWWMNDFHLGVSSFQTVFSAGWGEQFMYMFPKENVIILFMGGYYFHSPQHSINQIVEDYLLKMMDCRGNYGT